MTTGHQPPSIAVPFAGSDRDLADAGRAVAGLIEHQGFSVLCDALRGRQDMLSGLLMAKAPSGEGATYADSLGHMRGLAEVRRIAEGVVESGKEAEARMRSAEEEGQS